ncbi:hypothetical protein B0H19DRAFT_908525, partial [Mycena capillaripes]
LRTEPIYLTYLVTSAVNDDLYTYLSVFSGLQRLTLLDSRDPKEEVKCNRLAGIFFDSVLPRLSHSLVQLSCSTHYECRWSFGTHNASTISLLQHLSKL